VRSPAARNVSEGWPIPVTRARTEGWQRSCPIAGETFPVSDPNHRQPLTIGVSGRPQFLQPRREPSAWYGRVPTIVLSVGLHVTCLFGVIAITHAAPERTPRPKSSLTFAPVSLAVRVDALPVRRPEPARLAIRKIEPLPKPTRAPAPADEANRKIEPPAPVTTIPVTPPIEAQRLEPPPNSVLPEVERAPEPMVRVGAFEAVAAARPRAREAAAVMPGGFGDASARGKVRALPTAVVASGGFDREAAPPPPVPPSAAPAAAFGDSVPIEILFKPKPRYTDEAEALGIQGTVVLEVEFTASNDVRVLRVIRKLGHGLDEAAVRAAEQIRFKPARRQGVAVDSRVTVQIEFRLT
jgi:TonB family protein